MIPSNGVAKNMPQVDQVPVAPGPGRYMTDKIPMGRTGKLHEALDHAGSGRLLRHVTDGFTENWNIADSGDFSIILIISYNYNLGLSLSSLFEAMVRRGTPSWNYFLGDWNYLKYD